MNEESIEKLQLEVLLRRAAYMILALQPFAKAVDNYPSTASDDLIVSYEFTLGDLRRAKSAIEQSMEGGIPPEGEENDNSSK